MPIIPLAAALLIPFHCVSADQVPILRAADLTGWESKEFAGETRYEQVTLDGNPVIRAQAHGAASGRFLEVEVDLTKTPYLNWRWRVENKLAGNDERSKGGDDYPARVYVVKSGGLVFWRTKAVNYVWSSQQAAGSHWPNAFTSNAQMLAVRGTESPAGQWQTEKRNVREDFKLLFGEDIDRIDAVAFMTDTDNTGQDASAYYAEIFFSSD